MFIELVKENDEIRTTLPHYANHEIYFQVSLLCVNHLEVFFDLVHSLDHLFVYRKVNLAEKWKYNYCLQIMSST